MLDSAKLHNSSSYENDNSMLLIKPAELYSVLNLLFVLTGAVQDVHKFADKEISFSLLKISLYLSFDISFVLAAW